MRSKAARQSALMTGPKDTQVVVRMPAGLLAAVKEHQKRLQAEREFERVTVATAIRDLLSRALAASAKRRR